MLIDQYDRKITYARLALTDVCNLRCSYCMPQVVRFCAKHELLNLSEWLLLIRLLLDLGIEKIRFTGGEPLASPILLPLLTKLCKIIAPEQIHITTNATYLSQYLTKLEQLGIKSLNISLDTLKADRFLQITNKNLFTQVRQGIDEALQMGFQLKINMVVMAGINDDELMDFIELGKNTCLELRFIEEQPFQGKVYEKYSCLLPYSQIYSQIYQIYPNLLVLPYHPSSTAFKYQIPGYKGKFAIIPAFSRLLCHSCNRLRITPVGALKTCLYSDNNIDLKTIIRSNRTMSEKYTELKNLLVNSIKAKPKDGHQAAGLDNREYRWQSMNTIGG